MNNMKKISKKILRHTPVALIGCFGLVAVFMPASVWAVDMTEMDEVGASLTEILLGSSVRKIMLTIGISIGGGRSVITGQARPLITGASIGVASCFITKFIEWCCKL